MRDTEHLVINVGNSNKYREIIYTLTNIERKILHIFKEKQVNELSFEEILESSDLSEAEISRGALWLENKGLATRIQKIETIYKVAKKGVNYIDSMLPETRLLQFLKKSKKLSFAEIRNIGISPQELSGAIGILTQLGLIKIVKENNKKIIELTEQGENADAPQTEKVFRALLKGSELADEGAIKILLKRGLIKKETRTKWLLKLTDLGKKLLATEIPTVPFIEKLTPEIIGSGLWRERPFRWYDVEAWVPKTWGGRKHPLKYLMEKIREIFLSMGFREMRSPWVDMEFWCFDSMWIPQDHPAREMQSTFWLEQPNKGQLPNEELVRKVKIIQETGEGADSLGWRLPWDPNIASRCILRTHTTATTFRVLGYGIREGKIKPPVKFFAIGRVFRNETIDWKHLAEFHQIEGFVIAPNLTLRSLMGYIREFYLRMGIKKIRFKPTYNPYTEPSMEIFAWHKTAKKWVEVGNSGMFRPESLAPYGIKWPTIAWGLALERLAMLLWDIKDIRKLVGPSVDVSWIREYKYPRTVFG